MNSNIVQCVSSGREDQANRGDALELTPQMIQYWKEIAELWKNSFQVEIHKTAPNTQPR